ncbi:hypothetical protein [Kineosporia succinea]|uniref:Secreted protein with PEP-CTERM sorting signal n=1 Tax=Kineosporia succinea TaxID=84632 RepID=A0ABT9P0P9_9ACTN|nr:hypothetical protein [Kineosporia succinea]MDP9826254.1 hypothetical protein [Kineosporia succinea]
MDLWQWVVLVLGVLVLLTAVVYGIQARRRRGSVMAQRSRGARPGRRFGGRS